MSLVLSAVFLLFALLLVLSFSIFITALLRIRPLPAYLLSLYILSFANIVLVGEIAGLFGLLGNRIFFLTLHLVLSGASYFLWKRYGQLRLFEPIIRIIAQYKGKSFNAFFKDWPEIWVLALFVGLIYLFGAYLVLSVAPNNYDSMTSHMTRIGYWLQHGNFMPWDTWDYTQQVYPINAQIQMMWSIIFLRWDKLAGFSQWLSAISSMFAIYGVARLFDWGRPQAVFAGLVWALLPEVLLESTTVQNHLVVAALFICAFYFLYFGVRQANRPALILSGLSLALALGTHQLVFMTLPGIILVLIGVVFKYKRDSFGPLLTWGISCVVAFILVGSYIYVQNIFLFGNPFTPPSPVSLAQQVVEKSDVNNGSTLDVLLVNASRYFYASFDLTGIPFAVATPVYDLRSNVAARVFEFLKIPIENKYFKLSWRPPYMHEDVSWFGLVGFVLFPILGLSHFVVGLLRRDPFRVGIFLILALYISAWSVLLIGREGAWSPYQGRYFIVMATLVAPLMASLLTKNSSFRWFGWLLIGLSMVFAVFTTVNNFAKPLVGDRTIWGLTRLEQIGLGTGQAFTPAFKKVEEVVPQDAVLGLAIPRDFFEYPFFRKNFTQKLVPIYPYNRVNDSEWVSKMGINWIFLCEVGQPLPDHFGVIDGFSVYLGGECKILKRLK
jgi:hypothetical protein